MWAHTQIVFETCELSKKKDKSWGLNVVYWYSINTSNNGTYRLDFYLLIKVENYFFIKLKRNEINSWIFCNEKTIYYSCKWCEQNTWSRYFPRRRLHNILMGPKCPGSCRTRSFAIGHEKKLFKKHQTKFEDTPIKSMLKGVKKRHLLLDIFIFISR